MSKPIFTKVRVLWKHIRLGRRRKTVYCPIALALSDYNLEPYVTYTRAGPNLSVRGGFKKVCLRFVSRFDSGKRVYPFTFFVTKRTY